VNLTVTDSVGLTGNATLPLIVEPINFTFVDPNACNNTSLGCTPLPAPFGGDPSVLLSQGRNIGGVAADGVTQVIVWGSSAAPLTLSLGPGDGALAAPGSTAFSSSVKVNPVNAGNNGMVALAVYQAPPDFVRTGNSSDASAIMRYVMINVLASDGVTVLQSPIAATLVRPPVVLIHGFTSSPQYWSTFSPLIHDSRFYVQYADYSHSVPGSLQSITPDISGIFPYSPFPRRSPATC
jgi:hypothetical protein